MYSVDNKTIVFIISYTHLHIYKGINNPITFLVALVHWHHSRSRCIRLLGVTVANHSLFLSHFKFTDSANALYNLEKKNTLRRV